MVERVGRLVEMTYKERKVNGCNSIDQYSEQHQWKHNLSLEPQEGEKKQPTMNNIS